MDSESAVNIFICLTLHLTLALFHLCFTLLSHLFRYYAALSLLASKCLFVSSYALMALCDLEDPGRGDPRLPHSAVLLPSHQGVAKRCWCFWWAFSLAAVLVGLLCQYLR